MQELQNLHMQQVWLQRYLAKKLHVVCFFQIQYMQM